MSKIAELLKLAEKKKEDTKLELPSPVSLQPKVSVSKSNTEQARVSKQEYEEVDVTGGKQIEPGVSKNKIVEVSVSKSKSNNNLNYINPKSVETSPSRDYTKVSNSIMKRAIPEKYFRGLSKHTYDVLYQRTRGAIVPTRTIQMTKDELVRLTGISKDAIKLHIKYLKETGLLKSRPAIGSHAGWEYEILVPEEIEETEQVGVRQDKAMQGKASENLPLHSGQNLPPLTSTNLIENKETYEFPKTSLKTNTKNDDEAEALFSGFIEKFQTAAKKLTGAPLSKYEREKWERLADLLVLELETASRHATNPVSSIPAFLTKVLSSKLLNQKPAERMSKSKPGTKPDTVGKYYPELDGSDDEIKPLSNESRRAALDLIQEFEDDREFLESYKKWYTEEDWNWLMKELDNKTEE
jgi:hypothetical protein